MAKKSASRFKKLTRSLVKKVKKSLAKPKVAKKKTSKRTTKKPMRAKKVIRKPKRKPVKKARKQKKPKIVKRKAKKQVKKQVPQEESLGPPVVKTKLRVKEKSEQRKETTALGYEQITANCTNCGRKITMIKYAGIDTEGILCQRCLLSGSGIGLEKEED